MKQISQLVLSRICTPYTLGLLAAPAFAYIDPSAVTYTVQAIAGVVIAGGSALIIFRHKISALFRKMAGKGDANEKKEIHLKDDVSADQK